MGGISSIIGLPIPKVNTYDIRRKCDVPPLCYDFSDLDNFLKRTDVITELDVKGRHWQQCNMAVHLALLFDWSTNGSQWVAELADAGYKDFICNWEGGISWITKMQWSKKDDFNKAGLVDCELGSCKETANVKFIKFADAGH